MEMNNTLIYLESVERQIIQKMEEILMKENRNATHSLSNSFQGKVVKTKQGFSFTIDYMEHGKYVLDNRRRVKKQKPSRLAIENIMAWITNKGIPVGKGRLRTPLRNKKTKQLYPTTSTYKSDVQSQKKSFAFAIWFNIKKKGRTWAPSTNFLKPYTDMFRSNNFISDLQTNLSRDGIELLRRDIQTMEIQIKS